MTYHLAFYSGRRTILDRAIQFFTKSKFSHVELICGEPGGSAICRSSSGRDGGVREKEIQFHPDHWTFVKIHSWCNPEAWHVIGQEVGRKYDFAGILLSQFLGSGRHSRRKWFCSELCAHALGISEAHRLSPGDLYVRVNELNSAYLGQRLAA